MKTRVLLPERMDDPMLDVHEHRQALQGLRRINRWTGTSRLAWRPLQELALSTAGHTLRVLDVATGAGDVPIPLWKQARAHGWDWDIHACDLSETALEYARQNGQRSGAAVHFFQHDIVAAPLMSDYDAVLCSQFLHHLTEHEALQVIGRLTAAATSRLVIIDLVRSRLNWLQVWLGTRILSRSSVVHYDGPQSIRAAFSVAEVKQLARDSGLHSFEVYTAWPSRFVLVGMPDGDAP
mgnify:FL=1